MQLEQFQRLLRTPGYRGRFWDFDTDAEIADWTETAVNSSSVTAVTDGKGGLLTLTNATADNDSLQYVLESEPVKLGLGDRHLFIIRASISDATQSDMAFGFTKTATGIVVTPTTDMLYCLKADGAATLDVKSLINSAGSSAASVHTVDTDFHVYLLDVQMDGTTAGLGIVNLWVDGVNKSSNIWTTLPYDEELAPFFGVQNGEGAAKTMVVDYVGYASKD